MSLLFWCRDGITFYPITRVDDHPSKKKVPLCRAKEAGLVFSLIVGVLLLPFLQAAKAAARKKQQKDKQQKDSAPPAAEATETKEEAPSTTTKPTVRGPLLFRVLVVCLIAVFLGMFAVHCTWTTSYMYSGPSVILESSNTDGWVSATLPLPPPPPL